tara:strand:+ start:1986 stop:2813 length:828 start_codon:yes stop_codon:yes gene_type:complete
MREFLIATKFVWEYATHLQTDSNPPLELIFKFVDTLDKKSTRQHIRNFDKLAISKDIYKHKLPLRLRIKEEQFKKGTFGYEFKKWLGDDYVVDLFQISLVPYRATANRNTKFNKFAEHTMLQHDLIHFFNNYDTSPIGEVCVLSFNLAHEWRKSYATILVASLFMSIRNTFMPSKYPKNTPLLQKLRYSPIWVYVRLVIEGWTRGKKSKWFLTIDWHKYLDTPMEKVKQDLNLETKAKYWERVQPIWARALRHYKILEKNNRNKERLAHEWRTQK